MEKKKSSTKSTKEKETIKTKSSTKKNASTKKVEKKPEEIVEKIEIKEEKENVTPIEEVTPKKKITVGGIIKLILLIITSPIWFPWKVLFVRRKGRKFKEVSTKVRVFRILRSPITKPLKLAIYILILAVEVSLLYKVRYSPITYTITRASVHQHYLVKQNEEKLLSFVDDVYAIEMNKHYDEFKTAFEYVDEWELSEKNKMYVILDSKAVKFVFKYAADEDITYLLTRFNTEEELRNDIKNLVANINKLINRGMNEVLEMVPQDSQEIKYMLSPFTTLGKTLDYTVMLNTVGDMIEVVESQSNPSTMQPSRTSDLDEMIDVIIKYSKGAHLKELGDFSNYEEESSSITTVNEIRAN